jgi:molybdate transport system substrate-binding protein
MKTICPANFAQVAAAALTCVLLTVATARADEIKVVTSATFKPAYLELVPEYERGTHDMLVTDYGPSMGATHNAFRCASSAVRKSM